MFLSQFCLKHYNTFKCPEVLKIYLTCHDKHKLINLKKFRLTFQREESSFIMHLCFKFENHSRFFLNQALHLHVFRLGRLSTLIVFHSVAGISLTLATFLNYFSGKVQLELEMFDSSMFVSSFHHTQLQCFDVYDLSCCHLNKK